MQIYVEYVPTYEKPIWYYQRSPFRMASVWSWDTVESMDLRGIDFDDDPSGLEQDRYKEDDE